MNNYIEKLITKIQNITNASEDDAQKILVALTILGIAISWFVMGNYLSNDKKQNQKEIIIPAELPEDFNKK